MPPNHGIIASCEQMPASFQPELCSEVLQHRREKSYNEVVSLCITYAVFGVTRKNNFVYVTNYW